MGMKGEYILLIDCWVRWWWWEEEVEEGGGESVVYVCVRAMGWSILGLCQTVVNRKKNLINVCE
jgi:hypothetical protein